MKSIFVLTSTWLGLILGGCVSLGGGQAKEELQSTQRFDAGDSVVVQPGHGAPIYSGRSGDAWIQSGLSSDKVLEKTEAALATGEGAAAENLARSYLQFHPGDNTGLLYLANALVLQQRYQLAAYYARLAGKTASGNANLVNIEALAIFMESNGHMDDIRRAEQLFSQAFQGSDRQIAAGLNLGRLYMATGREEKAAEIYQVARQRCDCLAAWVGEGLANARLKKFAPAAFALQNAARIAPKNPEVMYQLALVQRTGYNDKSAAIQSLEQVLANTDSQHRGIREKAQSMLRQIRGEANEDERIATAQMKRDKLEATKAAAAPAPASAMPVVDKELSTED